jgi:hypothetical protein
VDVNEFAKYQADYRCDIITAKDIILPPFLNELEDRLSSFTIVEVPSADTSKSMEIEEELPLEGIPFVDEGKKTPQIGKQNEHKSINPIELAKSTPPSSTGSSKGSTSTA